MPSRVFRAAFARRGLAPRMLSRTVEDTGTVTSPLVPWNSCGAYMTGVLGVADDPVPALRLLQHPQPDRRARLRASPASTSSTRAAASRTPGARRPEGDRMSTEVQAAGATVLRSLGRGAGTAGDAPGSTSRASRCRRPTRSSSPSSSSWPWRPGSSRRAPTSSTRRARRSRAPTRRSTPAPSASSSTRWRRRSTASTASRTPPPARSTCSTAATLFGAIDVALFILVIGGFIGITMKTGAIQAGIALLVRRLRGHERLMIPILMTVFAIGGHHVRHGRGEPRLLRADHHGDDRRGVRRVRRRPRDPARLRHRRARVDREPVRHRHRVRVRRRPAERRPRSCGS